MKVMIGVEQEPRVQFTINVESTSYDMPDLIKLPDNSIVVYHGKYASPGNRFSYRRIRKEMIFTGPVKEWVEYTELKG